MKCLICNKNFKSNAGLGRHIKVTHKLTTQQYYDTYIDINNKTKHCPICGKQNKFKNFIEGYTIGCCTKHSNLVIYGVINPFQSELCKEKAAQTKEEKYGDKNYNNRNKAKDTTINVYGVINVSQIPEVKQKIKHTNLQNLGVEMPFMSNQIQEKALDTKEQKYGNRYYTNRDKYYKTMKSKGFISSYEKAFEECLKQYKIKYITQYNKDKRYPYHCDFYLNELDIFIEINIYPAHGPHPFNKNNKEDIKLLNQWKNLSINSPIYLNWIERWTQIDVKKRMIAKNNNLKYFELYNINDINIFLHDILKINKDFEDIYYSIKI